MKAKTNLHFITILFVVFQGCTAQSGSTDVDINKPFTQEQQLEDFELLEAILREACPILNVHRTEEEVNIHFSNVKNSFTEPIRISDYYLKIGSALSFFQDGHLRSYIGNDFYDSAAKEKSHIPVLIEFLNEKIYVTRNYSQSDKLKPRSEILSINEVSSEAIISNFKSIHSSDGNNDHFKYHRMNNEFRSYLMYYFQFPTEYKMRVRTNGMSQESDIIVKALDASTIEKKKPKPKPEKELFSIDYDDERKTAVFRFTTFGDQDGEKQLRKIMKKLVNKCNKQGIETLIIDIRDNSGGFDGNAAVVYSYLTETSFKALNGRYLKTRALSFDEHLLNKNIEETLKSVPAIQVGSEFKLDMALDRIIQPNERVFTGDVYLLINRATFSTATLFANIFHNNKRGIIVGQDAGGGYYGDSGGVAYIVLPNSQMFVQIPLVRNEYITREDHTDWITIKPDVLVNLSIEDDSSENDEVMDKVLDLIDNK